MCFLMIFMFSLFLFKLEAMKVRKNSGGRFFDKNLDLVSWEKGLKISYSSLLYSQKVLSLLLIVENLVK